MRHMLAMACVLAVAGCGSQATSSSTTEQKAGPTPTSLSQPSLLVAKPGHHLKKGTIKHHKVFEPTKGLHVPKYKHKKHRHKKHHHRMAKQQGVKLLISPNVHADPNPGDTLVASNGSWTGSPTSYTYQWQDCNVGATTCTSISNATGSTYTVTTGDIGFYIRVVVTAHNSHGQASANSPVSTQVPGGSGGTSTTTTSTTSSTTTSTSSTAATPGKTTHCFAAPGSCGYPDPNYNNVGMTQAQCNALPQFQMTDLPSQDYYYSGSGNSIDVYANNVTIANYQISGYEFNLGGASGTTFDHDCMTFPGNSGNDNGISATSNGTTFGQNTTVTNSVLIGKGCSRTTYATATCTGTGVVQQLVAGGNNSYYNNDIFLGAIEDIGMSPGSTVSNSFVDANGYQASAHTEDTYSLPGMNHGTWTHNTLFNPFNETAEIFIDNGTGSCTASNNTISNNLMAGGGFFMYSCSGGTTAAPAFSVTGNDLARCDGTATFDSAIGGNHCSPGSSVTSTPSDAFTHGSDTNGYWPNGGYFGSFVLPSPTCSSGNTTWSGNYWDDTGAAFSCTS